MSDMHIFTRYIVTDQQRAALGQALGLKRPADREEVRTFLQQQGELTLDALTLPLMAQTVVRKPATRRRAQVGV